MRLVEYPQNGRVLRRWTYERCGDGSRMTSDVFSQGLVRFPLVKSCYRPGPLSPVAHNIKQERIFKREKKLVEEEAAEEFQDRNKVRGKGAKNEAESKEPRKAYAQLSTAERRRLSKEPTDLHINEGAALKEMSKLYRDLLERFENLKQKQESQV
ncbi:unnamed protein product [Strongylus vulgaris]|uniref:Uncharacterized protein n=1 Tax=Strongylus vulgaris TaxID=40348 RepID=A0A3P7I6U9_STRVU|nr:unnamed protein product [Strongylus vulgaris]